ncbi:MAG: succinate dehydrogenase, cytochrome b556 subunit [Burkholderiaceae bacterium]
MSETSGARAARPVFRNIGVGEIANYRLPPSGIVSILHRVSGALLFLLGIPVVLYLLQLSLDSAASYQRFTEIAGGVFFRLVVLVLLWAFFHHLCAGIRFLLLDLHIGLEKASARTSALAVLGATGVLTLIAAAKLFGVF